jgi:hypothetical protein
VALDVAAEQGAAGTADERAGKAVTADRATGEGARRAADDGAGGAAVMVAGAGVIMAVARGVGGTGHDDRKGKGGGAERDEEFTHDKSSLSSANTPARLFVP